VHQLELKKVGRSFGLDVPPKVDLSRHKIGLDKEIPRYDRTDGIVYYNMIIFVLT
jgi:hypothetical protein